MSISICLALAGPLTRSDYAIYYCFLMRLFTEQIYPDGDTIIRDSQAIMV
jgi:hypothetical protein